MTIEGADRGAAMGYRTKSATAPQRGRSKFDGLKKTSVGFFEDAVVRSERISLRGMV